jgi:membrane-bound metal-dependent hydrolase YbcI (DUF457 family)
MTGKTHQSIGLLSVSIFYLSMSKIEYAPASFAAVLATSYFGSLLPDIDQPAGKLWSDLPFGKTLGKISDPFLEHRNITHSFLGFGIVAALIYYLTKSFPSYWGINNLVCFGSFMIAYGIHLISDMFTSEGIPLLYPLHYSFGIPPRPFEGIRIMTGKWFENLIIFPAINLITLIFIYINWEKILKTLFK